MGGGSCGGWRELWWVGGIVVVGVGYGGWVAECGGGWVGVVVDGWVWLWVCGDG